MIKHSAIDSPIFKLIETYHFDVMFGDDGFSIKLELFKDTFKERNFRCLFWQHELVEVGILYSDGDCIKKDVANHVIPVDWSAYLKNDYTLFKANDAKEALEMVFEDIRNYLVHTSDSDE